MPHRTVDDYLKAHAEDAPMLERLRRILLDEGLSETIKWNAPCYTHVGRNVVGLAAFKSYVGLWFYDGALLDDPDGVLVNAQPGTTRALRQWRFERGARIPVGKVRKMVRAARKLAEGTKRATGRKTAPRAAPTRIPVELARALDEAGLRAAFDALTPGRRREFVAHVRSAKRPETKRRRIAACLPLIARGEGLSDRYRRKKPS
ncbi:MAG: hypothetical protein D6705_17620 [Deltaproteobacteria bacterium]|nr:MAG: hypothetical protein D6705_17620 [Deltaproteobacteria bacterium]